MLSYRDASYWVFVLLGVVGALAVTTLLFYADFTLSQTFRKHRFLYHVMAVVIFIALLRLTGSLNALAGRAAAHTDIGGGVPWLGLAELYVSNAVLYVLTWAALKFRPNIE